MSTGTPLDSTASYGSLGTRRKESQTSCPASLSKFMNSWGITMRESDYSLDLLGTNIDTQLKAVNYLTFNVADEFEVIKAISQEVYL